jgi:hypothetical protein
MVRSVSSKGDSGDSGRLPLRNGRDGPQGDSARDTTTHKTLVKMRPRPRLSPCPRVMWFISMDGLFRLSLSDTKLQKSRHKKTHHKRSSESGKLQRCIVVQRVPDLLVQILGKASVQRRECGKSSQVSGWRVERASNWGILTVGTSLL